MPIKLNPFPSHKGYVGCQVDLLELESKIEIYYHELLITTITKSPQEYLPASQPINRKIAQNGQIRYKNHRFTIDYKLAGKKVEIQESAGGTVLLVYLDRILLKQFPLKA